MDIKWLLYITVFSCISIEPAWSTCSKTYISPCNYTIACSAYPSRVDDDSCGGNAYYTFTLTNADVSHLMTSFFASTNFDSRVRKIKFNNNVFNSLEESAVRYYYNTIEMDLSNNNISRIENQAFHNLGTLKSLNLSSNGIIAIRPHAFMISTNFIEDLDLSHNSLTALTTELNDLHNLRKLYLQNNKLQSILESSFQNANELQYLFLQHNQLTTLNLSLIYLKKLIVLDLSDNHLIKLSGLDLNRLNSIVNINVSHNDLSIVEANSFNQAYNLKEVDFSYNHIKIVIETSMFINNNKLKFLNFFNNQITGVQDNFLRYSSVDYLNLQNNNVSGVITEHTFSGLQRITELELTGQNLTGIGNKAFSDMQSLLRLNLSKNSIRTVDNASFVGANSRLLDLSHNKLQILSFLKNCLTNLTEFIISYNDIQVIPENAFESQTQIVNLDLSMNKIVKIEPKSLPLLKLQFLNITGNQLTGTVGRNVFSPAKYLRFLDLTHSNVTGIEDMAFVDLPVLARLNLSHNQIENIEPSNFQGIPKMYSLDASHNKLTNFSVADSTLTNLKALYLNNNNLNSIAGMFSTNSSLLYLDASNNNISSTPVDIGFETLPNLTTLNLASNKIKNFNNPEINTLSKLIDLNLSSNQLANIKLSYFRELVSVDLSNNNMTFINNTLLRYGQHLQFLDVSGNKITALPPGTFQFVTNLQFLNLSANFLTNFRYGSFRGLHKTKVLDISKNSLTSLEADLLHECNELNTLIIDYNRIKSLDIDRLLSVAPKLGTISLGGNPISCKEIIRVATSIRSINVTSVDKIYHEDNVHGIQCGDDVFRVTTTDGYLTTTIKPESTTLKAESDLSFSTIVLVWCSVLTVVFIGIGVVIALRVNKIRFLAYRVNASSRASLELNGSELQRDLLN